MMKKAILLLIICVMFFCASCGHAGDPPVCSELVTNSTSYLQINTYVQNDLSNYPLFPLPETIPANTKVLEYRYAYDCATFGDPNYSIKLVLQYPDETSFRQEQRRIRENTDSETVVEEDDKGCKYYYGNTLAGLRILTDNRIEDGNCAILQFIFLDAKEHIGTYAIGRLYDGSKHDDDIVQVFQAISNAS